MNRFAALAACVLVALPVLTAAQSARSFRGRLSPVPIPAALPTVTGVGVVTATLSGTTLTIAGTFEGLAIARNRRQAASRPERHSRAGGVRSHRHSRDERHDQRNARSDAGAGARISAVSGSTSSCTARRRPTAICGAGCWSQENKTMKARCRRLRSSAPLRPRRRLRCAASSSRRRAGVHRRHRPTAGRTAYEASCASCHVCRSGRPKRSAAARGRRLHEHVAHAHDAGSLRVHPGDDAARRSVAAERDQYLEHRRRTSCSRTARPPARRRSTADHGGADRQRRHGPAARRAGSAAAGRRWPRRGCGGGRGQARGRGAGAAAAASTPRAARGRRARRGAAPTRARR